MCIAEIMMLQSRQTDKDPFPIALDVLCEFKNLRQLLPVPGII